MSMAARMTLRFLIVSAVLFSQSLPPGAQAGEPSAELFRNYAYAGDFEGGIEKLSKIAKRDQTDIEARFGLGALQFLSAVKNLQQSLYQYGAGNQRTKGRRRGFLASIVPVLRFPVPPNPNARVASYPVVREILVRFVNDLQQAEKTLSLIGNQAVKLKIEPLKIAVDLNNDGIISGQETLLGAYLAMSPGRAPRTAPANQAGLAAGPTITFDTADVSWLQGYSNALMGISEFFLAFDFEETYDNTFHVFFGLQATDFGRALAKIKVDPEKLAALEIEIKALRKAIGKIKLSPKMQARKSRLQQTLRKTRQQQQLAILQIDRQLKEVGLTPEQTAKIKALVKGLVATRKRARQLQKQPKKLAAVREELAAIKREIKSIRNNLKDEAEHARLTREKTKLYQDQKAEKRLIQRQIAEIRITPEQLRQRRELISIRAEKRQTVRKMQSVSGQGKFEQFFDLVTFIHTLNWKVISPERLASVRIRLLKVMQLNYTTWQLVMAETDDDNEWLPNAKQKSPFPGLVVEQSTIDAWLATVKLAEDVLEGRKLLPHPRLPRGINLKKFFEEARQLDLVMFLTGPDALPYLEEGDNVVTTRTWRALTRPFNRRFGTFAVWFN